jgi:hypothetical protein
MIQTRMEGVEGAGVPTFFNGIPVLVLGALVEACLHLRIACFEAVDTVFGPYRPREDEATYQYQRGQAKDSCHFPFSPWIEWRRPTPRPRALTYSTTQSSGDGTGQGAERGMLTSSISLGRQVLSNHGSNGP